MSEPVQVEKKAKAAKPQFHTGEFIFKNPNEPHDDWDPKDFFEIRRHYRSAAKIHRKVREYVRTKIVPGCDMYTAVEDCEGYLRQCCNAKGASSINKSNYGQAFPMGVSINNIAAHYCPIKGDTCTLTDKDMVKVDFGVHNDGYLIDSAFTLWWDSRLDPIAEASKEATNAGLKAAGADVRFCDIGQAIEEVMTSFEFEGKPIHPVTDLCGHGIGQYLVHTDAVIPQYYDKHAEGKMVAGNQYACETFATNGEGHLSEKYPVSHYMVNENAFKRDSIAGTSGERHLFEYLKENFSSLAWCPRWLDTNKYDNYSSYLDGLVKKGYVDPYPQLVMKKGCYVAQFEHSFMPSDWGTEVFSRSDDY